MGVTGSFSVPTESFALHHALAAAPGVTVEADRIASHSTTEVLPFLWVAGREHDRFHRALAADPTVVESSVAEEMDEETLYRVQWHDEFCTLIDEIVNHHAAILEAEARDGEWHLRLRFVEERQVSAFQRHFREQGYEFEVNHLAQSEDPRQRTFGLTPEQYDALVAAVREGYFAVPRTTSVAELGDRLEVSANSVSQRLRRGTEALVRNALAIHDDG